MVGLKPGEVIAYPGHADGRLFVFFSDERASPVWKPVVGHVDVTGVVEPGAQDVSFRTLDMTCLGAHVSSVYGFWSERSKICADQHIFLFGWMGSFLLP